MLVFVPLSRVEMAGWAETGTRQPGAAYAVTRDMCAAFGFATAEDEDAEHTALHIAGLASLLMAGHRLVAVADASVNPVPAADFGDVRLGVLPWSAVTALFSESAPQAADALHRQLAGLDLAAAWDADSVADFLAEHELLWHGPGEWTSLAGG